MFAKVSKSSEWGKKTLFEWTILCRCSGVVFPMSMLCAVPNAVIAGVLQRVWPNGSMSLFGEDGLASMFRQLGDQLGDQSDGCDPHS